MTEIDTSVFYCYRCGNRVKRAEGNCWYCGAANRRSVRPPRHCPFCGERIAQKAVKCPHCAEFLDGRARPAPVAPSAPVAPPAPAPRSLWGLIIGLALIISAALAARLLKNRR